MEETMRIILAVIMSVCLTGASLAADTSCDADAKAKNLHGAAQTSFTKKCVKDASGV